MKSMLVESTSLECRLGATAFLKSVCFDSQYFATGGVFAPLSLLILIGSFTEQHGKFQLQFTSGITRVLRRCPGGEKKQSSCHERISGSNDHLSQSGSQLRRGG